MNGRDGGEVLGRRVPPGERRGKDFTYSVVEIPAGAGGDRRGKRRLRTRLREGLLSDGLLGDGRPGDSPGRAIVDCRIRDQSSAGARLQLCADKPLPRSFVLTDAARRQQFRATLVWQDGREAGVRLEAIEAAPRTRAPQRPFFR